MFKRLTVHGTPYGHQGHQCGKQHYRPREVYHPLPHQCTRQTEGLESPKTDRKC